MKRNWKPVCLALVVLWIVQAACLAVDLAPEPIQALSPSLFCLLKGGSWYDDPLGSGGYCVYPDESAPNPQPGGESEGQQPAPQVQPDATASGGGATPIPASPESCNATAYIHPQIEIVKDVKEQYYRECHYKLTLFNVHSEGIWILRRTNVSVHSSATNTDDTYWYSDLLFPGQSWEYVFRSNYFTDGQTSRDGVDRIAGVYNLPACLYLLTSDEQLETISLPIEWACGP